MGGRGLALEGRGGRTWPGTGGPRRTWLEIARLWKEKLGAEPAQPWALSPAAPRLCMHVCVCGGQGLPGSPCGEPRASVERKLVLGFCLLRSEVESEHAGASVQGLWLWPVTGLAVAVAHGWGP